MTKQLSVPVAWAIYEVPDDFVNMMSSGIVSSPPHVLLEVMVLQGQAKRLAVINSIASYDASLGDQEDASGLWDVPGEEDEEDEGD